MVDDRTFAILGISIPHAPRLTVETPLVLTTSDSNFLPHLRHDTFAALSEALQPQLILNVYSWSHCRLLILRGALQMPPSQVQAEFIEERNFS